MRINKFISETGFCSRRAADRLIEEKRVTINFELALKGSDVSENDEVKIDGELLGSKKKHIYLILNKPVGITTTTELNIKGNIIELINHSERIFPIGRLDKDSEGLIILTNNGDIVNKILRAENNHEKEYIVTVDKKVTDDFIYGMSNGVSILDTITKKCVVEKINDYTFKIVLTQGLNRQIRRMCKAFGYRVMKLQRVRIMNIKISNLKTGQWRYLSDDELTDLMKLLD
ncbi:MAG: pseudouridine synthase [Haloplasmataceae bacterium]|jgi:23S rRNA pseudouridine2604 synthase|nr:pseudouridine synthase [Haloplasmataceae bacterium]